MPIRALLFDVYGTLLDVHGLTGALERVAPGRGAALSALWRQKQIDYTRLRTISGRYAPLDEVTADGFDAAAETLEISLSPAKRDELLAAYRTLPPHPDAASALATLRGFRLGVLSNGTGPTVLLRADMDGLPVLEQTGLPYASTVHALDASGADVPVMHAYARSLPTL